MHDLPQIVRRLPSLLPWVRRRYPAEPWPWARCHCGALSDFRINGYDWCSPCKYAGHDTCECSTDPCTPDS
ncbi:hypothetical protein [Nocardia asiatica]|uniref:hypothetical protein n=1 Tax=Nocardia asiatica TaxID=209252 RepID=UPI0024583186|nr:hypothetical protein [Nocardia asiatica]